MSYSKNLPTAALLGNGSLGAVNGGDATRKLFVLTRGDFWSCGDLSVGYARNNVRPLSFADFEILPGGRSVASTDTLDISSGTLVTAGRFGAGTVKIESAVDANEDLFVVRGVSDADGEWTLRLTAHGDGKDFPSEAHADGFWVRRTSLDLTKGSSRGWTTNVTAAVRAVGADIGDVVSDGNTRVTARARVKAGRPFAFVVSSDPAARCRTFEELDALRERHVAWWRDWWSRSRVALGDAELERFYYGSLYLLGAGVRSGKFPPGLFGIWPTTDLASWHNDFHLNYNYVATFYGCWAANRCDAAANAPDPLISYLPMAEYCAKKDLHSLPRCLGKYYENTAKYLARRTDLADGIDDAALFPVALGPWGVSAGGDSSRWSQISDGVFQCAVFCTHWEYTHDRDYLKRVWPLFDRTANFFLKWCEKEVRADGTYRYLVYDSHWEGSGLAKNSAPALGCLRHLLETLLEMTPDLRALGIGPTDEKVAAWTELLNHLSDHPTGLGKLGGKDVPMLSGVERDDGRAEISFIANAATLEAIHPGEWCAFDMTEDFRRLATNCVHAMFTAPGARVFAGGGNQTPKLYTMAIRLGYPCSAVIDAFKKYEIRANMQKNFHLRDGGHGVEKIGAIEFVNSMLIQSDHGYVKVFPNWTGADAKFENLRAKGAFLVSSEMKGGRVTHVTVTSLRGGIFRLVSPWKDYPTQGTTRNSKEPVIELHLAPGQTKTLKAMVQ